MARLHEYQGKALLAREGIVTPRGMAVGSAAEARRVAGELVGSGAGVVLKIQAWTTNRKAIGGVAFASTAEEAAEHAGRMLGMRVGNFPVSQVLVEERLAIKDELFVSLFVDDRERSPSMLVSVVGGSGIEERARDSSVVKRVACDVVDGPEMGEVRSLLAGSRIEARFHEGVMEAVRAVFATARANEARSVEINPLVTTTDGRVVAADCRVAIDDYAVFRHPDLGIDIARELDHPPTELERIAYRVEQEDHRGTFFFAQMNTEAAPESKGLIGFHGAGGGGSMMSMDAITAENFTIANFCDTSGNPSSAKVYRAARIILSQPGLAGYFGSGSGVANQEQYWSAYGLAKAFWELELDIPAVIRLGGNTEDRAVEILEEACAGLKGRVEGYKKDDAPAKVARRFAELVVEAGGATWKPRSPRQPGFVGATGSVSFPVKNGRVWVDATKWDADAAALVTRLSGGLLKDHAGRPGLGVTEQELAAKDSELIACEVECRRAGLDAVFVALDIPGLGEAAPGGADATGVNAEGTQTRMEAPTIRG